MPLWSEQRENQARRDFVATGLAQRPPVFAVAGFFLAMWLAGWITSAALLAAGVSSIPLRYAVSCVVSYAVFWGVVGLWCRSITQASNSSSNPGSVIDGLGEVPSLDSEGCFVVLAVGAVALLLSGLFWFLGGYALLFEVAFEVAFAGTMVARLKGRHTLGDWSGTLLRRTWLPALLVAGLLIGIGAKLQHDHPEARTLAQAIRLRR